MSLPKIDPLDHHGGPFVTLDESHGFENVFDVAMAPVFAFNGGYRGNVCQVLV